MKFYIPALTLFAFLLFSACSDDSTVLTNEPSNADDVGSAEIKVIGSPLLSIPNASPSDVYAITKRLKNISVPPPSEELLFSNEPVGSTRNFWGLNIQTPNYFEFEAKVAYSSDNAIWYFPITSNKKLPEIKQAIDEFEKIIWPKTISLFAPELKLPGKIAIVHGSFPGLGGYFSPSDALPQSINRHSNLRMGIYLSEPADLTDSSYLGTLTHELQHLLHWHLDKNEEAWIQEGLSELAARKLNYQALPFSTFLNNPQVSITNWPSSPGKSLPNYAAASLFAGYLYESLQTSGIATLVSNPLNGPEGIDSTLKLLGSDQTFEKIFQDWLIANYLNDPSTQYSYSYLPYVIKPQVSITASREISGSIQQRGAWYAKLEPEGEIEVTFEGAKATAILPVLPHSGEKCWWSNRGNSINSQLTRTFDLSDIKTATLNFKSWWDIENEWDHGYVTVSNDQGQSWEVQKATRSSIKNPLGTALGPSYTGQSKKWRNESIDLSPYVGNTIMLRFEYITDESISTSGWCIDDLNISELDFFDNFEEPDENWISDGFVKMTSRGVRQSFTLIYIDSKNNVSKFPLNTSNKLSLSVNQPSTLIITASAPKTSEYAHFNLSVKSKP